MGLLQGQAHLPLKKSSELENQLAVLNSHDTLLESTVRLGHWDLKEDQSVERNSLAVLYVHLCTSGCYLDTDLRVYSVKRDSGRVVSHSDSNCD